MDNFNSDPKPGRLILPLVLIGKIKEMIFECKFKAVKYFQ